MYSNDKNHRITIRLSTTQFNFLKTSSDILGVSPSEFLRMVINSTMAIRNCSTIKDNNDNTN